MTEQPLTTNALPSRLQRNGRNSINSKTFTSQLTEENLKLHTTLGPSARETKTHLVLVYVDLQKQLVALETQMRMETKAAQEKFALSLPKDTPSVIPEVIHIPINKPTSTPLSSPPPIEDNDLSESCNIYSASAPTSPTSPTLKSLIKNMKGSHRIKSLFKNTSKPINDLTDNKAEISPIRTSFSSYFERDNTSLKVEPSSPPSLSQSSQRSKSLRRSKTTLKRIFISKPTCNRANSADTMNTMNTLTHNNFTSPPHNINAFSPTLHSPSTPSTPMSPNCSTHLNNEIKLDSKSAINNERCENIQENRDSGIALVSPGGRSNHSREHSFSTLLRKIDPFNNFQKDGERKDKTKGPIYSTIVKSKEYEQQQELLAFRYPSLKNIKYSNINNIFDGIFDRNNCLGNEDLCMIEDSVVKQKCKVKFNTDDMQASSLDEGKKTCSLENSAVTLVSRDIMLTTSELHNK
ncbi:14995_t:CDS:2 [Dentiscutata erythropus]|uniref:14995_t:CDS:1 n=1 Tax=Dentiscutata erythropus TaxID=1348616 RepID=A0A9N9A6K7_9GLOM|nr:14995_t:CDS:2 [Dentiscutata erythropus]